MLLCGCVHPASRVSRSYSQQSSLASLFDDDDAEGAGIGSAGQGKKIAVRIRDASPQAPAAQFG